MTGEGSPHLRLSSSRLKSWSVSFNWNSSSLVLGPAPHSVQPCGRLFLSCVEAGACVKE